MTNTIRSWSLDATNRGPSVRLWGHKAQPFTGQVWQDPRYGHTFWDDFSSLPTGKYTATQATAGTFALGDAKGGSVLADCNSTTAAQGINVQLGGTAGESVTPSTAADIYFEALVKAADIATGPEFFLGFSVTSTAIIASSANASANHIGFESVSDDGVILFHSESGGTRSSLSTVHTFVDDDWVKLGFVVRGTTEIEAYVNGAPFGTKISSNIPTADMRLSLVCQSGGTTDPIVHVDWWGYAQVESWSH